MEIVASRCHALKLKCTKFDFGWGSGWPPTLRPNQPIWAVSPPKRLAATIRRHHRHLLLPVLLSS